jgi:hypothetical protein
MNNSKIVPVVITAIAAALLASSTVGFASHVFAQKDDSSNSGSNSGSSGSSGSSSTKDDYDKFQKCLSDAATDGSATKQQIKDCYDSTYGSDSSSSSGSDNTGNSGTGTDSGSKKDNNGN